MCHEHLGEKVISELATKDRQADAALELAVAAACAAEDSRGTDTVVLDLRSLTTIFDYFVVTTGQSGRQLHAISEEVDRVLEQELGDRRMGIEGYQSGGWVLLDYGSVVIHIFEGPAREYYDLEQLWAGCKRVDWRKIAGREAAPE